MGDSEDLQTYCRMLRIWDEVNPKNTTPVDLEKFPEISATLDAGAAAAYDIKIKAFDGLDARRCQVLRMIYASLDTATKSSVLGNHRLQEKDGPNTLRAVVQAVKDVAAPSDDRLRTMFFQESRSYIQRQNVPLHEAAEYLADGAILFQPCVLYCKSEVEVLRFFVEGLFQAVGRLNFGLYHKYMGEVKVCTTEEDMVLLVHGYKKDIWHLEFIESSLLPTSRPAVGNSCSRLVAGVCRGRAGARSPAGVTDR